MEKLTLKQACSNKKQVITLKDLPLSCPPNAALLWNAHPKIYLALDKKNQATCPYCGTAYRLDADE